jgi:hypothetical protein
MHRFTEPTPTTLIGKDLIHVVVASWGIQCGCSPLPTIGHPSTWVLMFVTDPTSVETGPDVGKGHGA